MATEKQHSSQKHPPNFRKEIPGDDIYIKKKQNSGKTTAS